MKERSKHHDVHGANVLPSVTLQEDPPPAGAGIQIICLGSGGGPSEENVTGFLVRATGSNWSKGSLLAVDAGSHLAAVTRILESDFPNVYTRDPDSPPRTSANGQSSHFPQTFFHDLPSARDPGFSDSDGDYDHGSQSAISTPTAFPPVVPSPTILANGPFAGLPLPFLSARANAVHVVREHVSTYLITHPHLDHISGFAINTAAYNTTSRPKTLAALPFTVEAIKAHIFNDVIWPNLTDEDGGVGFVTFQRLAEGGNIALGEGGGRGYIEVCDGLSVRALHVSHGHCMRSGHTSNIRGSASTNTTIKDYRRGSASFPFTARNDRHGSFSGGGPPGVADALVAHHANNANTRDRNSRSVSLSFPTASSQPGTPAGGGGVPYGSGVPANDAGNSGGECVVDSTAFFIRTYNTIPTAGPEREILVFGDVEPDSISLAPRNARVWQEAAPKIAAGILRAIFIECSYDDSQHDAVLFGHLAPRHVIAELSVLADFVRSSKREMEDKEREREERRRARKRKRETWSAGGPTEPNREGSVEPLLPGKRSRSRPGDGLEGLRVTATFPAKLPLSHSRSRERASTPERARHGHHHHQQHPLSAQPFTGSDDHKMSDGPTFEEAPLRNVKIVIIHVKDTLKDGPLVGDTILAQLKQHDAALFSEQGKGLGCEFLISRTGASYWV